MHTLRRLDRIAVALLDIAQPGIAVGNIVLADAVGPCIAGGYPGAALGEYTVTEAGRGWQHWGESLDSLVPESEVEPSRSSWM